MAEETQSGPAADGEGDEGTVTGGQGMTGPGEKTGAPRATPPMSDEDQEQGKTQYPAPDEDVGVPDDPEKG